MASGRTRLGRPDAAEAVAALVLALAERQPAAAGRRDRGDRPRGRRVTEPPRARSSPGAVRSRRDRDGDPAPDRRQDVTRRAARAVHDDARRRSGGPVRDGPQHPRAAGDRPVRARSRGIPLHAPRPRQRRRDRRRGNPRPRRPEPGRGIAPRRHRYIAESGVAMARAATETQKAGLTGLEFGLAIPGTVGGAVWANAGAHDSDVAAVLESARLLLADGTEALLPAAELDLRYRDSRVKTPSPGRSSSRRRSVSPQQIPKRSPAASTRSGAGAASTSHSASRRRARHSATHPATRQGG